MLKYWPPLNTLRGFEAAARLGSFHKAAAELNLTQSAISQQIRSLEDYLGQALFFRQGRSIVLTDAGKDFFSSTQTMLQQLVVNIRRLDQYQKNNQLIVNTTPAFSRHWLLPRLKDFYQQYPTINIWLLTTYNPPDMAKEAIDIAIRDDINAQPECSYKIIYNDSLYPACHPDLLALDMKQRVTLHGEREMDWSNWVIQGGENVGQITQGPNFSDPSLLLDAVCDGLGIGLVSQLLAYSANEKNLLLPLTDHRINRSNWAWLIHKESDESELTTIFCEWVLAQLKNMTSI